MALAVVGGALLSAFIDVLFDRLASPEFVNFIRGKKPEKLLQKMKSQLLVVKVVLADAEKRQISNSDVKDWLDLLRDLVYEVDDLLDEVSTKAATQKEVSNSFSRLFIKKKIVSISKLEEMVEKLDDLLKQKECLDLKDIPVECYQPWKAHQTSLEDGYGMYGRDKDKEAILKMVLEDSTDGEPVSVIPIVGMGGVGKTTLARSVFNDDKLKQEIFDLKAWVCVSDLFDIVKVTRTMIEEITRKACKLSDLNALQLELTEKLKGKRFLIVLDDVWIEDCDNWSCLTKPFLSGSKGSKVVVTTRNENVAAAVPFHRVEVYRLNKLSNEDCWLVFANHAFPPSEACEDRETIEKIGKEIVKKCNGLPLAAQSLGGMLRRKNAVRDWNNVLESDIWELPESQCKIIPALRISYHYLPPHLKRCFVYCSLYPKDYAFDKDELIQLWMAEDLVKAPKKGKTLEEVGHEYFYDLVSRSFFQCASGSNGDDCFVMHDLMHDLATFIGGEFYFRADEIGKETKINRKTRHLSFTRFSEPVSDIEGFDTVKFTRTFLVINYKDSPFNNEKAPYSVVSMLKYLRVLSFCGFKSLFVLPDSIGELIHLRYLNLSHTSIETLPDSLCSLCNLQTLKLVYCPKLIQLPIAMQNLVNLRHLEIHQSPIKEMPKRMGKLNQLQKLDLYIVGKRKENSIKELGGLPNLCGSFCIKALENVTKGEEAIEASIMDKKHINHLSLKWSIGNDNSIDFQIELDVLGKLQPHQDLQTLSISGYKGTGFPEWVGNFCYRYMTSISLYNCNNCCMLPSMGQLPSLKFLYISDMNSVKTIDAGFYKTEDCSSAIPFPSLESLHIFRMPSWEVWTAFASEAFPVLKDIFIFDCPKLRGAFPNHLPALQRLIIRNCELLVSSVPRAPSLRTIEICNTNKVTFHEFPLLVKFIDVEGGPTVESMMEAMTNSQPTCLKYLTLRKCSSAISFPGDRLPASLKALDVRDLNKLKFPMQHKHELLESLKIKNSCDSLMSLPLAIFPSLTHLDIRSCENMESVLVSGSESLKSLKSLMIQHCPSFVSFLGEGLSAPNLSGFSVFDCEKLKSLPNQMGSLLPNLEYLNISNCQLIESFPEGGMPPNITVWIENCEKLLSSKAWVCMDMVTSLGVCGPCDGINSFPEEALLPPSLTSLSLHNFTSLETLDCKGFLHLTSLRELDIQNCEKLKNIGGESLPVSLMKLSINGCPLLQERCHKKDCEIWPKICHVRVLEIEGR